MTSEEKRKWKAHTGLMIYVLLLIGLMTYASMCAGDAIELKDDGLIVGTVNSFTSTEVKISIGNKEQTVPMSEVVEIRLKRSDDTHLRAELTNAKKRIKALTEELKASGTVPSVTPTKPNPSEIITMSDLRTMGKKISKLTTDAQKSVFAKECLNGKSRVKLPTMKVISVKSGRQGFYIRLDGAVTPGIPVGSSKTHITVDVLTSNTIALKLNTGDKLSPEGTFKKFNWSSFLNDSWKMHPDKMSRIYFSLTDPCQLNR